jgi:pimeloyl-ACP methyl ester carboxylesterase
MVFWIFLPIGLLAFYLLLTLWLTYLVQQIPRHPVTDPPDWGHVEDLRVPTVEGGSLETWRVRPDGPSRGTVVLVHGWGRNRDRMVHRARLFGRWGFTAVVFSVRDHGRSTPRRFMNAVRFAEDTVSVLDWVGEPVVLYGHSAGSAGALIAAVRRPEAVRLLILEGSYARTGEALLSLYRWVHPLFGRCFGPMIVFWMQLFYRGLPEACSPVLQAPRVRAPVLLVHGADDRRFPVRFARTLRDGFAPGQAELFVAEGAGHSDASRTAGYGEAVLRFLSRHGAVAHRDDLPGAGREGDRPA